MSCELLLHEAPVSGRLEDLQPAATVGGVHDGADALAGELVLPGQGEVVRFPEYGPVKDDKVSCKTPERGRADRCLKGGRDGSTLLRGKSKQSIPLQGELCSKGQGDGGDRTGGSFRSPAPYFPGTT